MTAGAPTDVPSGASAGPGLLLVAHGTRDPAGAADTGRVADAVAQRLGVPVAACFVDVRPPSPADALAGLAGPCVAVPLFLAAGYHVRTDLPAQLADHPRVRLAEELGPDPELVEAAAGRLAAAGARPDDAVVLAVAGSSDPRARADGSTAARLLGRTLGRPVTLATVAGAAPRVADAVTALRRGGAERVAVASWLLAEGRFQSALRASGADVVADPLADHPTVIDLVVRRYRATASRLLRTA